MLPWTAFWFAVSGTALWIDYERRERRSQTVSPLRIQRLLSVIVLTIGIVMAFQRLTGQQWSVNRLFFPRALELMVALALRLGLNPIDLKLATAAFVLAALALPQLRLRRSRR